jgi:hypothetical protein
MLRKSTWEIEIPAINFSFSFQLISDLNNIFSPVKKMEGLKDLFSKTNLVKQ